MKVRFHLPALSADGQDEGASLIIALIFILAIGLVLVAILNLATGTLKNTTNLRYQRSVEFAADGATNASIQWVRNSGMFSTTATTASDCMPDAANAVTSSNVSIAVWCIGGESEGTRTVTFFACSQSVGSGSCAPTDLSSLPNLIIRANVTFFDSDPQGHVNCPASPNNTCGIGMIINSWDVNTADN